MKRISIALLVAAVLIVVVTCVGLGWFFFYSGDLPNFAEVVKLTPDTSGTVSDVCSNRPIQVVPFASLGTNLRNATHAAEGQGSEVLATQISRNLFCESQMRMLQRHLLEYKAAVQLRNRFTPEQLLTIYLNQSSFGDGLTGVESASLHYFSKPASELDVGQAALIAGLLRAPSLYSPERHPDRAKERRNEVLDAMLRNGAITAEQAGKAKQSELR